MADQILTQELVLNCFDYKDGHLYRKKDMRKGRKKGQKVGCINQIGYVQVHVNGKIYLGHRIIFLMHHGYLPKYIDHIDGNKSNNLIENLREATNQQNAFNSKIPKSNTSGIKNVCWSKAANKWMVRIKLNYKGVYFGVFDDLELAELVAIEARDKYFGKFARHV